MKGDNISLAVLLAEKGAIDAKISTSTSSLASETGLSQQSISRKLRELHSEGIIHRQASPKGIIVSFTNEGKKDLESLHIVLKNCFSVKKNVSLKGKLVDGLGEGKYYTSLSHYNKQFAEILGSKIFLGTFNLEVNPAERNIFTSKPPMKISGFKTQERSFGGIDCWHCSLNGQKCLAILPHRTNHPENILELISSVNLRKKFNLKAGDYAVVKA